MIKYAYCLGSILLMGPQCSFSTSLQAQKDYGIVLLLGDQLNLKVLINRGLLYYHCKDYGNALHDFLLAANVCPDDKKIHHTLGLCYHK